MTTLLPAALSLLLQSTALLLLGLLALRLVRRRGPAVQSLIGRATLAGVGLVLLAAPLAGHVRPLWHVTLPVSLPASNPGEEEIGLAPLASSPASPSSPIPPSGDALASRRAVAPELGAGRRSVPAPAFSPAPPPPPDRTTPTPQPFLLRRLYTVLAAVWGTGTALLLLWLGLCQWHLTCLRRQSHTVTSGPAADLLAGLTPRPPVLRTHPTVRSPFLAGLWHPAIFLPAAYGTEFDPTALRAILTHELAHLTRRDNAWTLAARLLCALLWPQSLLWALCRRLEQIGEEACDQAVLAGNCPPRAYADCLLTLAERHPLGRRERALGAGVTPVRSSLGRRVQRILDKATHGMSPVSPRLRLTIAAFTVAAALGGAFLVPSAPAQTQGEMPKTQVDSHGKDIPKADAPVQQRAHVMAELIRLKAVAAQLEAQIQMMRQETQQEANHMTDAKLSQAIHGDPRPFGTGNATENQLAAMLVAAQEDLANKEATLPASALARQEAEKKVKAFQEKKQFLIRIRQYTRAWITLYNREAEREVVPSRQLKDTRQQIKRLKAKLMLLNNQIGGLTTQLYIGSTPVGPARILRETSPTPEEIARYLLAGHPDPELSQAQFLAGLTPVQGPGVVVTLNDSKKPLPKNWPAGVAAPSLIHETDINQVVNELKSGAAEAIAVNDQRLVATSSIRTAGPTIYVNNTPQVPPYVIKAIGNPKMLATFLNIRGGIASQIKMYDSAMFSVREDGTLTLPAFSGESEPRYAKPAAAGPAMTGGQQADEQRVALAKANLHFMDSQVRLAAMGLIGAEKALVNYRDHHPASHQQSDQKLADLTRDYTEKSRLYASMMQQRDKLQLQLRAEGFSHSDPNAQPYTAANAASPTRNFLIEFRVPRQGTHRFQIFLVDDKGERLVFNRACQPGAQVQLPLTAHGKSVSFRIYDNGKLKRTI